MSQDVALAIAQLVPAYLERGAAELLILEDALRGGNLPAIQRNGHNLRGSGSGYGFSEIAEIGRRMETAAKDGSQSEIRSCLVELKTFLAGRRA